MYMLPSLETLAQVKKDTSLSKAVKVGKLAGEVIGALVASLQAQKVEKEAVVAITMDASFKIISYLLCCPETELEIEELRKESKEAVLTSILLQNGSDTKH